jgi:hypothetical protein
MACIQSHTAARAVLTLDPSLLPIPPNPPIHHHHHQHQPTNQPPPPPNQNQTNHNLNTPTREFTTEPAVDSVVQTTLDARQQEMANFEGFTYNHSTAANRLR